MNIEQRDSRERERERQSACACVLCEVRVVPLFLLLFFLFLPLLLSNRFSITLGNSCTIYFSTRVNFAGGSLGSIELVFILLVFYFLINILLLFLLLSLSATGAVRVVRLRILSSIYFRPSIKKNPHEHRTRNIQQKMTSLSKSPTNTNPCCCSNIFSNCINDSTWKHFSANPSDISDYRMNPSKKRKFFLETCEQYCV